MGNIQSSDESTPVPERREPLRVIINAAHAKSGGGVTYLRNILPVLSAMPELELHLFIHKNQFDLFYPICEKVNVTLFAFRPTFFRTLFWEQVAIPLHAWGMGGEVVFSPANFGPIFARNHVIMLRNAVSVIQLSKKLGPVMYWLALTGATFVSLLTAKKAIAVSSYAKKLLTFGFLGSLGKKCAVIHHGTRQVQAEQRHIDTAGEGLLAVSDVYIQKNYHTLLHAHAQLVKKFPALRLTIVGREIDHAYSQSLYRLSKELGLGNNIVFKGHVGTDELLELYKKCRVFVFPSLVETFGNPLLEAMAIGAPIACSKEAAMPEVLRDAGLYFDPKNKSDMADKIETLLADKELGVKLGKEAAERARTFTWENTAQQTYAFLREAAEPRSEASRRTR